MTAKKIKLLILIFIVLLTFAIPITKCSLERNGNWVYREFKTRMNNVPYGYGINSIDIRFYRSIISFYITVEPDCLTRTEIYILGKHLIGEIENEYLDDASLKGAQYMFIYPISDNKNEDFRYMRPTSERRWCFTGDLGDGQEYSGAYLDEMPDFGD